MLNLKYLNTGCFICSQWICSLTFLIGLGCLLGSATLVENAVFTNTGLTACDDS